MADRIVSATETKSWCAGRRLRRHLVNSFLKLHWRRFSYILWRTLKEGVQIMATATLDWSQCPAVESVPGRRSGAWVFKDTRMPVATVFENLQDMSVDELIEEFGVTREQV